MLPQTASCVLDRIRSDLYDLRMPKFSPPIGLQQEFFAKLVNAEEFAALFRGLTDVHFYMKDAQSRFMAANSASLQRYGLSAENELVGKTDFDLHPPALAEAYVAEDRQVMQSSRSLHNKSWLVYDHLGVQKWYLCTKTPLLDRRDRVAGIAASMQPLDNLSAAANPFRQLTPAVEHVLAHFAEKLRMETLAQLVGLSVSQLDRRFNALLQTTPSQYIQRVRINEACSRLSKTMDSVSDIAAACGFYDQAQLTRLFKRHTGITPTAYRRRFGMP